MKFSLASITALLVASAMAVAVPEPDLVERAAVAGGDQYYKPAPQYNDYKPDPPKYVTKWQTTTMYKYVPKYTTTTEYKYKPKYITTTEYKYVPKYTTTTEYKYKPKYTTTTEYKYVTKTNCDSSNPASSRY